MASLGIDNEKDKGKKVNKKIKIGKTVRLQSTKKPLNG
jgi:hypothetical protein